MRIGAFTMIAKGFSLLDAEDPASVVYARPSTCMVQPASRHNPASR